jgi:Mrp family chromosome partitioning ATPase
VRRTDIVNDQQKRLQKTLNGNHLELTKLTGNLVSAAGHGARTYYVTSARSGEGKTTVAAALAYGLAIKASGKVALVEANLNSPELHSLCGIEEDAPGFFDFLLGQVQLDEIVYETDPGFASVIPGGSVEAGRQWVNSFEEDEFQNKLAQVKDRFLYSVFDGDSVLSSTGSVVHSHMFDGTIIAVECNRTKWQVVDIARNKLLGYGAHIVGVVLNKRKYPIPDAIYSWV